VNGLVEIEPDNWDDLLGRLGCADLYLLRDYFESARVLASGRPVLLHLEDVDGDVVFPFLNRTLPGGRGQDVTTPYGYGGPVATGANPPTRRFWQLYQAWCEANGVVTSFISFHPLFANQRQVAPSLRVEPRAGTIGWRLDRSDLFAAMDGSHRTACRKAERAGVSVTVVEAPDDLSAFSSLYDLTMRRVEADEFYLFGSRYWETLVTRLRQRIVVFDAVESGEVIASALCLGTPPWLHYHLGATGERARPLGASNLLLYEAARWARDRGYERFPLGGGTGGANDSLLSFKRRFDPGGLLESAVGKAVHDAAAYRELTGRDAARLDGFFPAYREAG
jgi:serine/alanine adding enzyme